MTKISILASGVFLKSFSIVVLQMAFLFRIELYASTCWKFAEFFFMPKTKQSPNTEDGPIKKMKVQNIARMQSYSLRKLSDFK